MEEIKITQPASKFKANDGKLFDSPEDCLAHESDLEMRRVEAAAEQIPQTEYDMPCARFSTCRWYRLETSEHRQILLDLLNIGQQEAYHYSESSHLLPLCLLLSASFLMKPTVTRLVFSPRRTTP